MHPIVRYVRRLRLLSDLSRMSGKACSGEPGVVWFLTADSVVARLTLLLFIRASLHDPTPRAVVTVHTARWLMPKQSFRRALIRLLVRLLFCLPQIAGVVVYANTPRKSLEKLGARSVHVLPHPGTGSKCQQGQSSGVIRASSERCNRGFLGLYPTWQRLPLAGGGSGGYAKASFLASGRREADAGRPRATSGRSNSRVEVAPYKPNG